jgi:glutathione peroxidase
MNVHEYVFLSISGAPMPLSNYRGQPILIVNTASECGYTPQYAQLQRIWEDYRQSSLMVIGIPSNDFGQQEPGDEAEIAEFCETNYSVNFPMTSKQSVHGISAHPLFQALRDEAGEDSVPRWNFWKYLFGRDGGLVAFWPSRVTPDDPAMTHQIERNISSWVF